MREHQVPTHLQAEDKILLGLTFPQIVSGAAIMGLAYGVWRHAGFLPDGSWRLAAAIVIAVLGLTGVGVRPGGRALPIVVLNLIQFALAPRRYEGDPLDLLRPRHTAPNANIRAIGRSRRLRRIRLKGLLFRCLSVVLAATVILASIAPPAAMAAVPGQASDGMQRLFIERWHVQQGQASVTVRAATPLSVQVMAEAAGGQQTFHSRGVLYRDERREYVVRLKESHRAIVISWHDALGDAGMRVLERDNFPFPPPSLDGADCSVTMTDVGWHQGAVTGHLASTCRSEATEVVDATVLTDPANPDQTVRQRLLLDAVIKQVTGSLTLVPSGPGAQAAVNLSLVQNGEMPFAFSIPQRAAVHAMSLEADLVSTRMAELPERVDLTRHEDETVRHRVPVVAWFNGFFTRVTGIVRAAWSPFVRTVKAYISAWFAPVTRTLSATLTAAWGAVTQTVGGWVSATVGGWVSTVVGTQVWTTVSAWLSATVGTWVSTTVGTWLSATVGTWVSTMVGGFYTTVTAWIGAALSWFNVNVWVPGRVATGYASATASGYASAGASGYASGTAYSYVSARAGGYATGRASGYAEGQASTYASTQVTVPERTGSRTVSESVTLPGQTAGRTVTQDVWVPGRTAEQEAARDVWVPGREVRQEADVEVVIPAYTSAEVTEQAPLVRQHRDRMSISFALLADAIYEPLPEPPGDGDDPSEIEQYVRLLDEEASEGDGQGGGSPGNPYRDALDQLEQNPYFVDHPDEATLLRTELFVAWLDSLSVPLDARTVMEGEAGAVASERGYRLDELPGGAISGQAVFRDLLGEELR